MRETISLALRAWKISCIDLHKCTFKAGLSVCVIGWPKSVEIHLFMLRCSSMDTLSSIYAFNMVIPKATS